MPPKQTYSQLLAGLLAQIADAKPRPRLALHACCAPCSSAVLELLARYFDITILYYNPNTWPEAEFLRRGDELARFVSAVANEHISLVRLPYTPAEFYTAAAGLEAEPERGSRCTACYTLRLERTAQYAAAHGFDFFCSTLSISPHKDAVRINTIGAALQEQYGVRHLPNDFKKKEGYKRSLSLSAQYGLYRQSYCGCEFSAKGATGPAALPPM